MLQENKGIVLVSFSFLCGCSWREAAIRATVISFPSAPSPWATDALTWSSRQTAADFFLPDSTLASSRAMHLRPLTFWKHFSWAGLPPWCSRGIEVIAKRDITCRSLCRDASEHQRSPTATDPSLVTDRSCSAGRKDFCGPQLSGRDRSWNLPRWDVKHMTADKEGDSQCAVNHFADWFLTRLAHEGPSPTWSPMGSSQENLVLESLGVKEKTTSNRPYLTGSIRLLMTKNRNIEAGWEGGKNIFEAHISAAWLVFGQERAAWKCRQRWPLISNPKLKIFLSSRTVLTHVCCFPSIFRKPEKLIFSISYHLQDRLMHVRWLVKFVLSSFSSKFR